MSCDFIIASEDAKFGQPEINVGAIPGAGGSQRMPRYIGKSKVMYAILTGDMIDAYEAEKCGLVAKVFKSDEFNENIIKISSKIANKSSALARLAKDVCKFELRNSTSGRFESREIYFYVHVCT